MEVGVDACCLDQCIDVADVPPLAALPDSRLEDQRALEF
jgi:hypothetical protein